MSREREITAGQISWMEKMTKIPSYTEKEANALGDALLFQHVKRTDPFT